MDLYLLLSVVGLFMVAMVFLGYFLVHWLVEIPILILLEVIYEHRRKKLGIEIKRIKHDFNLWYRRNHRPVAARPVGTSGLLHKAKTMAASVGRFR
jgi:hypothetical protein